MLGGAHDTMGMGYGVLTPVLNPETQNFLRGLMHRARECEKLTRRLESTGGAAAKKLKKPVFTLSHEIAALFGEQTRLARDPGCYSRRCPAQAVRRATITQITHPTDDRDDVSQNTAAVPASPRASRLASATSFEMRATRSVDGGPRQWHRCSTGLARRAAPAGAARPGPDSDLV